MVATNRDTVPSQTPQWLDAVCTLERYEDASRLYETSDGRQLILPLVRWQRAVRALSSEYSMAPGWHTGGLLAAEPLRPQDVRGVVADLAARPVLRTIVRPDFLQSSLWVSAGSPRVVANQRVTNHVVDLTGGPDDVWKHYQGAARTAVRKAERSGVEIESDTGDRLVPEFYALFESWIQRRAEERHMPRMLAARRGHQLLPLDRINHLARTLGDTFRVWVARRDGEPVASIITLMQGNVALYWRGASNKELAGPVRANDYLQREAMSYACARGCTYYNMGESGGVASLERFKARFGAEKRYLHSLSIERLPFTSSTERMESVKKWTEGLVMSSSR